MLCDKMVAVVSLRVSPFAPPSPLACPPNGVHYAPACSVKRFLLVLEKGKRIPFADSF